MNMELVVGVIFPAKKIGHLRNVLHEHRDSVRFVLIDLHDDALRSPQDIASKYGSLHVVLHKLAHEMVFARLGDDAAARRLALMTEYAAQHPEVAIVDPIDSVQLLTDRHDACRMLQRLQQSSRAGGVAFNVPPFRVVQSPTDFQALLMAVDAGETALPLICKSVEACATDRSHMMTVITKRSDLQQLDFPVIYQEFINHSGRLFKGYVLGEIINVAERRSLPNLRAGDTRSLAFNTQEQYPTAQDFDAGSSTASSSSSSATNASLSQEIIFEAVRAIGQRIREELRLSLFGFDVIVSDATREYFVIDVNYFPSYKELEDFDGALRRHLRRVYEQRQ
ncbi:hypothetical protein PINS_up016710 [Pythium insidiosum]|nr:hypothetical protein PINS_up016710 [Pythium insidiosum]